MFDGNIRTLQRIAARMQRVLIVDPHTAAARLLSDHLRHVGGRIQIFHAGSTEAGWGMARTIDPVVIFVEHASAGADGLALARKIRRSDLDCRECPIIMCTAEATAEAIYGARDAGIHEFMRKPFTIKDLERRLEAVTLKPRDWVEAVEYVGPDRRRFNSAEYKGPRKRKADASSTPAARMAQALRIVKSAGQALDSDPAQARRALAAQAVELKKVGEIVKNAPLVEAAVALGVCMAGDMARTELVKRIKVLMGFLVDDPKAGRPPLEVA